MSDAEMSKTDVPLEVVRPVTATPTPTSTTLASTAASSTNNLLSDEDDGTSLDTTPVTPRELKGWYLFGFASQGYTGLVLSVFSPIILQSLAANAGFDSKDRTTPCNVSDDGYDYATTIATLAQAILFISMGALADYGGRRKSFLLTFAIATAICGYFYLVAYKASLWWVATLAFIFSTITYGAAWVFEFAYLPILSRYHPDYLAALPTTPLTELHTLKDRITHRISAAGISWGASSAFLEVIMGAVVALALGDGEKFGLPTVYPLQIATALSSTWLIIGLYFPHKWLKQRPGPPLPEGEVWVAVGWKRLWATVKQARQLATLWRFLIGWFIFSDGFNTILSIAILFFQADLGLPQTHLLGAAIVADFCQAAGVWFWVFVQRRSGLKTRSLLMIQAGIYSLVPLWGLIGLISSSPVGLRNKNEIWILGAMHGLMLGGVQSGCRVLFSELCPKGMEGRFFSLYAITENGAAWMGPLIVAAIGDSTGNRRYAFIFIFCLLFFPIFIFRTIDVEKGKEEVNIWLRRQGADGETSRGDTSGDLEGGGAVVVKKGSKEVVAEKQANEVVESQ
ncbi:Autophagy protein 22 [Rhizophlyctis rosea]|nr:Autophagy protein 22 [Rhizophlyctis rosea]